MTTKTTHLYRRSAFPEEFWPVDLSNAISAESLVYFDQAAGYLKPLVDDTNAAYGVGVCMDEVPVNLTGTNLTPNPPKNVARVVRVGQFQFKCTAGQAYSAGLKVYAGADAQTVTPVAGSNPVGYVSGEQEAIVSAAATDKVLVCVRAKYPAVPLN